MTAPDLAPLRAWLAAHPSPDEPVAETRGGDVRVADDGPQVMTMPWVDYHDTIPAFWVALRATGWDAADTGDHQAVVTRWLAACGETRLTADQLGRMDRHTLLNALRWLDRGERFSDGLWASAFRDGLLHAGARALVALG